MIISESLKLKQKTFMNFIHESYLKTYQEYLKRVYKEHSELYCNKTEEYVTELANLKSAAITRYNNSVIDMFDKLEYFHKQLVTR